MQPTSIRLPADIQALIRSLAAPGESTSSVICRAIRALAGVQASTDTPAWVSRIEALERRLEALERSAAGSTPVVQPVAAPVAQAVVRPVAHSSGTRYPSEVKAMALEMQAQGVKQVAIMQAIKQRLGYCPDRAGIGRCLERWARERG